jgi:hypothetical protein
MIRGDLTGEVGPEVLKRKVIAPMGHVRANYTLERGIWHATCRDCTWQTSDPNRRRAVAMFRLHHIHVEETIDLSESATRHDRSLSLSVDERARDPRLIRDKS